MKMRNTITVIAVLMLVVLVTSCESVSQRRAKEAISAELKDPSSALFSDFTDLETAPKEVSLFAGFGSKGSRLETARTIMRVKVNAKNSFGAYAGAKQWLVFFDQNGDVVATMAETTWSRLVASKLKLDNVLNDFNSFIDAETEKAKVEVERLKKEVEEKQKLKTQ